MFSLGISGIWAVATIGKIVIAAFSWRARERHPFFVAYSWVSLALSVSLWGLSSSDLSLQYFWTYYLGDIAKDVLLLGVLCEIVGPMFFPLWILPPKVAVIASGTLVGLVVCSVFGSVLFHSQHEQLIVARARTCDKAATLAFFAALGVTAVVSGYLRISWLRRSAFIATGFSVFLFLDSAVFIALTQDGRLGKLQILHLFGYLLAEAIWAIGLLLPDDESIRVTDAEVQAFCGATKQDLGARGVAE